MIGRSELGNGDISAASLGWWSWTYATAITLGNDILAGQHPQFVIPQGNWQAAESLGEWTLVGCTVAPGFEFATFELAPPGWVPQVGA